MYELLIRQSLEPCSPSRHQKDLSIVYIYPILNRIPAAKTSEQQILVTVSEVVFDNLLLIVRAYNKQIDNTWSAFILALLERIINFLKCDNTVL
ncbi:hypothetical protein D3C84_1011890 [compost metagenome]